MRGIDMFIGLCACCAIACGPQAPSVSVVIPNLQRIQACGGGITPAESLQHMRVRLYVEGYMDQPCGLQVNNRDGAGDLLLISEWQISGECNDIFADSVRNMYVVYTLPRTAASQDEKGLAVVAGWYDLRGKTGFVDINMDNESLENFSFAYEQSELDGWPAPGAGAKLAEAQLAITQSGPIVANEWWFNNSPDPLTPNLEIACSFNLNSNPAPLWGAPD